MAREKVAAEETAIAEEGSTSGRVNFGLKYLTLTLTTVYHI